MDVGADAGAAFHSDGIKPYYDGKIQSLKVRPWPGLAAPRACPCPRRHGGGLSLSCVCAL